MTPPQRPPPVQMREHLSRLRDTGEPFARAWHVVLHERILWPHETATRRASREALAATRDEWRAAYEGSETRLSRALRAIREQAPAKQARESGGGVLAA